MKKHESSTYNHPAGVIAERNVSHMAPPARHVPKLISDLFGYLKNAKSENPLITSSVFHYEIECIHPFSDGNGRMGCLWQTVILTGRYPVFAYIPIESVVKQKQTDCYEALVVQINVMAPDFVLNDFNNEEISLSGYRNKKNVLLVFNRGFM